MGKSENHTPAATMQMKVRDCIREMLSYIEAADYAGYDPYDALNSPLIRGIGAGKWARLVATQLARRSPVNLRSLFGIRKAHNPKGIGLFLWGYSKLYGITRDRRHLEVINYLLDLLESLRSEGWSGNCWGYNFDWQSRTFMRPKGTPMIVNTALIGHALLDCYEVTNEHRVLDMAVSIKDFILGDLHRMKFGDTFCFSYTPIDTEAVHNANLLGASILARLTRYCEDDRLMNAVSASLNYSMRCQREDGSWFYADTDIQGWVDSFHTGFNLQAIRYILDSGIGQKYDAAYRKGVAYYANHFFLDDGTPKYYHDRIYPIDIQAPAQAIYFFSREGREYEDLADRVLGWTLENMYSGSGFFYFRKGRLWTNRTSYMRWSQASMFNALSEYLWVRR